MLAKPTKLACSLVALLFLACPLLATAAALPEASLNSGNATLTVNSAQASPSGVTVSLSRTNGTIDFSNPTPLSLELLDGSGGTNWLASGYSSIVRSGDSLVCRGKIQTTGGTVFDFNDTYAPAKPAGFFSLSRQVTVSSPATNDAGFLSRFSLRATVPSAVSAHDFFIPGVWYLDNKNVPSRALAVNLTDNAFIIREDRMPLPLVLMRDKNSHATITLIHGDPDGSTCLADYTSNRVTDARIQVASLGVLGADGPAVAIYYPAAEGERSYLNGRGRNVKRWVERFHPVQPGVKHSYQVLLGLADEPDFPTAMRHAWRAAYDRVNPVAANTDVNAAYEASLRLIADWSRSYNGGAAGLPFRLKLPGGQLEGNEHINFQMGFVGQQLPLAYHLLRYGLLNHQPAITAKGEAMVNFWASNSLTAEGLPRTWFDVYPEPHWRKYDTFMRIASDGMVGALMAWDVMQRAGNARPEWLAFCRRFGDWLIQFQNPDGSWYREYDWNSHPVNEGKQNTTHPIRFLVDLAKATREPKYLAAAVRAGNYCYPTVHEAFAYVGGTADNPNVMDKEAGFMAMDAFLALHDATGDPRWLKAAAQAADFTETWVYAWNIPIPAEDQAVNFPRSSTTAGFSIIATGNSGADLFMAGAPFLYYRLYAETGDANFAQIARLLLYDTKQAVDINGSLGYGHSGLCTEALTLAPPRGHGVNTWLPWLTFSMIEPLVKLQETFGSMDIPSVKDADLEKLRAQDAEFGRTRGLFTGK